MRDTSHGGETKKRLNSSALTKSGNSLYSPRLDTAILRTAAARNPLPTLGRGRAAGAGEGPLSRRGCPMRRESGLRRAAKNQKTDLTPTPSRTGRGTTNAAWAIRSIARA